MTKEKVRFIYSEVYDELFRDIYLDKKLDKEYGSYPAPEDIKDYLETVEMFWKKRESNILNKLTEITDLKWKEDINCYLVGWAVPFSDPLTIPTYKGNNEYFIGILMHELIHVLLIQNLAVLKKYWAYLDEEYTELTTNAKNHVIVHAVLKNLFEALGFEEQLAIQRKSLSSVEDYSVSWEIVDKGDKEIVDKMRSFLT